MSNLGPGGVPMAVSLVAIYNREQKEEEYNILISWRWVKSHLVVCVLQLPSVLCCMYSRNLYLMKKLPTDINGTAVLPYQRNKMFSAYNHIIIFRLTHSWTQLANAIRWVRIYYLIQPTRCIHLMFKKTYD